MPDPKEPVVVPLDNPRVPVSLVPIPQETHVSYAEQLRERFDKMRAEGLLDLKVQLDPHVRLEGVTLEEMAKEMLDILDCFEQKRFVVDITHRIDPNAAARPEESDHEQVRYEAAGVSEHPANGAATLDSVAAHGEVALGISPRLPQFTLPVPEPKCHRFVASYGTDCRKHWPVQQGYWCDNCRLHAALRDAQQRFQQAVGCPHDGNCACAVTSRHEAFEWFCAEREALSRLQSRVDDLEGIIRRHNRG